MFVVRVRVPRTSAETNSSDYERYEGRRTKHSCQIKRRVVKPRASQATRSEKAKCLCSSVEFSFLSFFFFEFASTQIASGITQIEVHFLGRETAIERTAMGKTRGWRGWSSG